ncbi:MAG: transposase [Tolypothrix carrinoi HA7290-LM1]|nr:transposase [Tolypothrix carrinoi HA7290-LM1]
MEYKAEWYGSKVVVIDRFYPSSQLCSNCGHRQPMPLHLRTYDCPNCGISIDRDLNASLNIRDYSETAASSAVEACGRDLPGGPIETGSKPQLGMSKIV